MTPLEQVEMLANDIILQCDYVKSRTGRWTMQETVSGATEKATEHLRQALILLEEGYA